MKVKLTGIIEVQVEVETEIDDVELNNWAPVRLPEDTSDIILDFLRHYSDDETEIWRVAPPLEDGEVLTAEFVEAEVLGV